MQIVTIKYNGAVLTLAGFRGVTMTAKAEQISAKRAKVLELLEIDGEKVVANMSRTGAKRQSFYGHDVAIREEGRIKNLSSCEII